MRIGIRLKFLGIIGIAALIPLLIGMLSLQVFGERFYTAQKGDLFQTIAGTTAERLDSLLRDRVEGLDAWLEFARADRLIADWMATHEDLARPPDLEAIGQIDRDWAQLEPGDPFLQRILTGELATLLTGYRTHYPLFAEILITDDTGRLIAATNKTSDYWQADEEWWRETILLPPHTVWIEGIAFDESAGVFSASVSLPIYNPSEPGGPVRGVIKGVINVSPLFGKIVSMADNDETQCHLLLQDGTVLVDLEESGIVPRKARIPEATLRRLESMRSGWFIGQLNREASELIGYAPFVLGAGPRHRSAGGQGGKLFVLVHQDESEALGPVHAQLWLQSAMGLLLVLVFSGIGLDIAQRRIIRPLQLLDRAARAISARASLGNTEVRRGRHRALPTPELPQRMIKKVEHIHTEDEIEDLAREFALMARRVMNYHEQLEKEIEQRVREDERDLRLAREFQESLLPSRYPRIPTPGSGTDPVSLGFSHIYKPARTLGGDFFDILKLNDHQAGVFIADVMGHGARSALITAMLRTLLQNAYPRASGPAHLLETMNRQFAAMIPGDDEVIFASAFYVVLDTRRALATYASAGHPSPLRIHAGHRMIEPVLGDRQIGPALGLIPEAVYRDYELPVEIGDVFLLFTDGVLEARSPLDEEFGMDRLHKTIAAHFEHPAQTWSRATLEALHVHMSTVISADDICLLTVEVAPPRV